MKKLLTLLFSLVFLTGLAQQTIQKGMVLNRVTHEPVAGATVMLSDSSAIVVTDNQGKFNIPVKQGLSLHITAIGFEPADQ